MNKKKKYGCWHFSDCRVISERLSQKGSMEIFRSVTQSVLGTPHSGTQSSGAETVERLLDRVQSSTLLEDRRDGCRALKALSRKYRLLVGAHGMDTLIQVLESDRSDHEIVNYALETLVNITSDEMFIKDDDDENAGEQESTNIGEQFTEIFIKRVENIGLVMSLMDEFDFKVRFPAMKLLNNLLRNRPKEVQEVILVTPSGVSKLMDMLSDSREIIRNDTLLLLTELTKGNTNLQKIVAFENAFDHLFGIVKAEDLSDGGVVVGDCLGLMLTLLKNNPSNQTFFKEECLNSLTSPWMVKQATVAGQRRKVANVHYMLKLLRILVSPQNSAQAVASCQESNEKLWPFRTSL
ncbi:General vesicular transport factor [Armadillidium nasatum]|uniref:General vesicular transport factor n=1 Tax=Armadillidium nasatum TaxID=96803 RepID=A0A5N5T2I1_9CRUS|nr:General vesicular transport factor [Armadillidium nasatum]